MSPGRRPNGTPSVMISPTPAMVSPISTRLLPTARLCPLPSAPLDQIDAGKEVADFERRRVRRVRAVGGVALDGLPEFPAQRAGAGLGRIGLTHERPPFRDAVRRLEDESDGG